MRKIFSLIFIFLLAFPMTAYRAGQTFVLRPRLGWQYADDR